MPGPAQTKKSGFVARYRTAPERRRSVFRAPEPAGRFAGPPNPVPLYSSPLVATLARIRNQEGIAMKAAYIEQQGGPEVFKYGDLPDPKAGAGEIAVDIAAASVNG